jgi:hypothetical protein
MLTDEEEREAWAVPERRCFGLYKECGYGKTNPSYAVPSYSNTLGTIEGIKINEPMEARSIVGTSPWQDRMFQKITPGDGTQMHVRFQDIR